MSTVNSRLTTWIVAAVISAIALSGCATKPLTQVKEFGQTTKDLSANANEVLSYLDRVEVQRKLHAVAANPKEGPKTSTFEPFFKTPGMQAGREGEGEKLDSRREALNLRLALLKSLSSYAGSLEAIASAEHYDQLDAATKGLNTSLVDLSETYKGATGSALGVSNSDFGLLSTLMYAVGRSKINKAQIESLRKIVPAADPYIQKAAVLLSNDLSKQEGGLSAYAAAAVKSIQTDMQLAYNLERKEPGSTYEARLVRLEKIESYNRAAETLPPFFDAVGSGARKMASAHASLAAALQQDALSGADLAKALAEFKFQVDAVQAFRESLNATK